MNKLNEIIEFDDNSLVYIDQITKGHKTLEKILDKRGVKWTGVINKECTHLVCTRLKAAHCYKLWEWEYNPKWDNVPDEYKKKYKYVNPDNITKDSNSKCRYANNYWNNDGSGIKHNEHICYGDTYKYIVNDSWEYHRGKRIYSYSEFKRILDNDNRKKLDADNGTIIELLKTCDPTNVDLAIIMTEQYEPDPKWIPWLLLNSHNKNVRKYLKSINIPHKTKYNNWYNRQGNYKQNVYNQKGVIIELLRRWNVPKDYHLEFLKELYNYD